MLIPILMLIGFFKVTGDIINNPATFRDSWFKRFKGNKWIDPVISQNNKWKLGYLGYPIMSMFGDACHTAWTLMFYLVYLVFHGFVKRFLTYTPDWSEWTIYIWCPFWVGFGAVISYILWRKVFNK